MSDSHIYELEDIVWDDFSISDDHLVPYPQIQQNEGSAVQTESHKKVKHEAGIASSAGSYGAERVGVSTEKTLFSAPKTTSDKILASGSWSHNSDTCEIYNDLMANLSSEGLTVTRGDIISNNDIYIGSLNPINNTAADNCMFYSLSDTSQSESDLSFLCNGHEHKEIDDSLFYEWPEIGNYDLSQMLRSCDSAFGQGDLVKQDDRCWFSSSTAINGSDASSQSLVRSSNSDSNSVKIFSENCESPQPTYESPTVDARKKRSAGASYTSSTLASTATGQSCLTKPSSINELHTNSDKMDREKPIKKVSMHSRNMDYQTQSVETNVSPHHFESSKPTGKTQHFFSEASHSHKLFSSNVNGFQKQNESLNKNSPSDEHPLEETSFLMLQEVMEQMDLKTKLCIRDSLYRLARSAEQRHGIANRIGKIDKNACEALIAGTRQASLLDIETDTNPIDRSIAHLLFHRPSDPSKMLLTNTRPGHNLNDGAAVLFRHEIFKNGDFHVAKREVIL